MPEQEADFKSKKLDGRYVQAGKTDQDEHLSWLTMITWRNLNVNPAVSMKQMSAKSEKKDQPAKKTNVWSE